MNAWRIGSSALLFVSAIQLGACNRTQKDSESVKTPSQQVEVQSAASAASTATPASAMQTTSIAMQATPEEHDATPPKPSGKLFSGTCSQCFDKPCGMEVQSCTSDARCRSRATSLPAPGHSIFGWRTDRQLVP
jgi:hypothetical protein